MIKDDILGLLKNYPEDDFTFEQILQHFTNDLRYRKIYMKELQKLTASGQVMMVGNYYRLAPTGIRKKLLDRMVLMNLDEQSLAMRAEVHPEMFRRWLRGANTMGPDDIGKIAVALGGKLVIDVVF